MENPIKMDDLGVPLFSETPIYWYFLDLFSKCLKMVYPPQLRFQPQLKHIEGLEVEATFANQKKQTTLLGTNISHQNFHF